MICYEVENGSFKPKERSKLTQIEYGVKTVKSAEIYRTVKIQPANIPITQWNVDEIIQLTKTRGWFRYAELGDIYN